MCIVKKCETKHNAGHECEMKILASAEIGSWPVTASVVMPPFQSSWVIFILLYFIFIYQIYILSFIKDLSVIHKIKRDALSDDANHFNLEEYFTAES